MRIYTVFVRDRAGNRFIDTSWAREQAACARVDQLRTSMKATGFDGNASMSEMAVEDLEPIAPLYEEPPSLTPQATVDDDTPF